MGLISDLFGKKPKVPQLPTLESAQTGAIGANIASFADIAALATQVDQFNQTQLEQLMERTLPGGRQQVQEVISSQLRGEIPSDVLRGLRMSQAERGVGALTQGSGFNLGQELSSQLGMSLALQSQGLKSAEAWLAGAKTPNFDVSSMFITPQMRYMDTTNQFQRQLLENKIAAAPDPGTRGLFDASMSLTGMILSAYGGGAGYQGTYNPESAYGGGGASGGFGGTSGPGGFYMGGNNWGFGRTSTTPGGGGGNWFLGKQPGKG